MVAVFFKSLNAIHMQRGMQEPLIRQNPWRWKKTFPFQLLQLSCLSHHDFARNMKCHNHVFLDSVHKTRCSVRVFWVIKVEKNKMLSSWILGLKGWKNKKFFLGGNKKTVQ